MKKFAIVLVLVCGFVSQASQTINSSEAKRLEAAAQKVTIVRDDWGIAHVSGKTDADAVFGMIYAQADDDFNRVETNFINSMGRLAESEGEAEIWRDLRMKLFINPDDMKAQYEKSPTWLKALMNAWADGLNFYLIKHPAVKPKVIQHFEPWMALTFSEGSIGGDIEKVNLNQLQAFYTNGPSSSAAVEEQIAEVEEVNPDLEPRGSNGMAVAPSNTTGKHALLLINPHTSFYFRSELQMTSDVGLNVYGAATWGQFFIYQGFNPHAGWMHTSSGVDVVDEFAEKVQRRGSSYCYWYGRTCRAAGLRPVTIRYRSPDGRLGSRTFTTLRTHHGPIVRNENGRWIAFAMMNKPVEALQQSFLRTKATDLRSFLGIAGFKANSSNNTLFADDKGEIAYLHPQFVPRRDDGFDYTKPVDGSDPRTDWKGLHALGELPSVLNPKTGWAQNTNAWPYRASGTSSAIAARFPRYMDTDGENYRGLHAQQMLSGSRGWTLDKLQSVAFDS